MEKGQGNGTDTLQTDNVFTRKEYIDRDALVKSDRIVGKLMMFGGEYVYTQTEIDRAPTIIPAEEGK